MIYREGLNHEIYNHGYDSAYTQKKGTLVYNGKLGSTTLFNAELCSGDVYSSGQYYTYFSIENFYDAVLKEEVVTPTVDNNTYSYNTNFMENAGSNSTTGQYRFRIFHRDTGMIRTAEIKLTPTANFCWEDGGNRETKYIRITLLKYGVERPDLEFMTGDEKGDKGETVNNTGATWDESTRTATFIYDGSAKHIHLTPYNRFINVYTASSEPRAMWTPPRGITISMRRTWALIR